MYEFMNEQVRIRMVQQESKTWRAKPSAQGRTQRGQVKHCDVVLFYTPALVHLVDLNGGGGGGCT